jgi:hypothetical protein
MNKTLLCLVTIFVISVAVEPNPPIWPMSVQVLDPATPEISQQIIDAAFAVNGGHNPPVHGQFSTNRFAFLFKPGSHAVDVNVGFYTSIYGIGKQPSDVDIRNVICENGDFDFTVGALDNFWRSAENFATTPTLTFNGMVSMVWAVSQAAPLRKVQVAGTLNLYEYNYGDAAGFASGGFIADCTANNVFSGSQQQFFARNSNFNHWTGGVWNMVFVGVDGSIPASHCGNLNGAVPSTIVDSTPVIAEKPFVSIDNSGRYSLNIPRTEFKKKGTTADFSNVDVVDFCEVYVATANDTASVINQKLQQRLHLILTPGIYNLEDSIRVTFANTTVLGMGFATLVPTTGKPAIIVEDVDGVRIAGILLQAGSVKTDSLLQFGNNSPIHADSTSSLRISNPGSPSNPSYLIDVFARVGGMNDPQKEQVATESMLQINAGNVVIDNSWLWRADHDITGDVKNSDNPVSHGIQVLGQVIFCCCVFWLFCH